MIAHYTITGKLGQGGMGEVYRATDTKLGRDVALKILPEAFTADPQRMARFEREARLLASLNHPNIGAIYGLEDSGSSKVLVLELVGGETLAEHIARGPIRLEEGLKIARQIADALQAAHAKGIVHRDLKPANIKITPEGIVKVLDFGLAKAAESSRSAQGDPSHSPTLTMQATQAGMILGTAAYMSPEQARGEEVDHRADIWAFGVVLYEMLTGKSLFAGRTVSDTLAAVLTREPDWPAVPSSLQPLLRACLQREPETRLRDIGDAWLLLDRTPVFKGTGQGRGKTLLAAAAALLLGVSATTIAFLWLDQHTPRESTQIRFLEYPPAGLQFVTPPLPSPDGRLLAMRLRDTEGQVSVWIRSLDGEAPRKIEGTDSLGILFWSPDSNEIIIRRDGFRRVRLDGTVNSLVAQVPLGGAGVWAPSGDIFIVKRNEGIVTLSPDGGTPRLIIPLQGGGVFRDLDMVPNASQLLLFQFGEQTGIYASGIDGSGFRSLVPGRGANVRVAAPDQFLYLENRLILAQRFNPSDMTLVGDPVPIASDVDSLGFEASRAGVVSFFEGEGSQKRLSWFDRNGQLKGTLGEVGKYSEIYLSPKGDQLAFVADAGSGNRDLWLQRLDGTPPVRLTSSPDVDHLAAFSPDGSEIIWESHRGTDLILMRGPSDGSRPPTEVLDWNRGGGPSDWSSDGEYALYTSDDGVTLTNIWAVPMTGEGKPFTLIETEFNDLDGRFSPDGRWLAYVTDASGRNEVYLQALDGIQLSGGPHRVSTGGGMRPLWRRDSKELFFMTGTELMAVDIYVGADRPTGTPHGLFRLGPRIAPRLGASINGIEYAPSPDGQSFLFMSDVEDSSSRPATIIVGWNSQRDR